MKRVTALLLLTLVALAAAGCSGSAAASATADTAGGQLTIKDVWARAAVAGADTAVYFTIVNGRSAADTLTGVTADVAQSAGLHQTTTDTSGMTGMQMLPTVPIPGGGTVAFAPGGYHVMLTSLKKALNAGDSVQLTLTFQNAGTVNVTAEVRAN